MGIEFFLGGILEPNTDIYSSICPWNKFKLIFFKWDLCNSKQIHTFFLLLSSSIFKLNYLCYFRLSISEIRRCSSPLNLRLNSIVLTWFGFFKSKLCPISHDDLIIMDWFSRANLYDFPCVNVSFFGSEIDITKIVVHVIVATFYRISIRCSERELTHFSHRHLFQMKFKSLKQSYLPQIISPKILRTKIQNFYRRFLRILASHCKNFSFWNFVYENL